MCSEPTFECSWQRHEAAAWVRPRGVLRGAAALDAYLATIDGALEDPEVRAIVSDLREVTRLPTVLDCVRFGKRASMNPHGARVGRSAVVTATGHPVAAALLRLVAGSSRFFPERRIFVDDIEAALAWAGSTPARDSDPGRGA